MADDDFDDDEIDDDEQDDALVKRLRKQVKDQGKELREKGEQAEANAKAARDLSFLRAGIDLDDPKAAYFIKGYEGEMTPEAIKAEAVAAGIVAPPEPDAGVQGHEAVNEASAGATGVNTSENAEAEHLNAILTAPNEEAALAAARAAGVRVKDPLDD